MPVVGVGWVVCVVFEHGNRRNRRMILVDWMRHIDLAKVPSECNVLLRSHRLISKKDDLVCHERVIDRLRVLARDVPKINIDLGAQGGRE